MINDKLLNIQYGSGSLSFYKKDWLLPAAETTDMGFNFPLTAEHAERYTRVIEEGAAVRRHYDFLIWLQGELQHYLPHEIMLAAWGDFNSDYVHHDIASALLGVRTDHSNAKALSPLLQGLFSRWTALGKTPYTLTDDESVFLLEEHGLQCPLGAALRGMRSALIHGISDKRGQHDCLYVMFSSRRKLNIPAMNAIKILLPYIDAAMGQVEPVMRNPRVASTLLNGKDNELGIQEMEILNWVKAGKTNSEIAGIMGISMVALKNHFRNIFKKLHEWEANAFKG